MTEVVQHIFDELPYRVCKDIQCAQGINLLSLMTPNFSLIVLLTIVVMIPAHTLMSQPVSTVLV